MTGRKIGSYAALLTVLLLPACMTAPQGPPTVDVSGTWIGTWNAPGADEGTVRMQLQQKDGQVSGTLQVTGNTTGNPSGRLEGVVAGNVFSFRVPNDPLSGDLTVAGDAMTGTGNRNTLWYFALGRQR